MPPTIWITVLSNLGWNIGGVWVVFCYQNLSHHYQERPKIWHQEKEDPKTTHLDWTTKMMYMMMLLPLTLTVVAGEVPSKAMSKADNLLIVVASRNYVRQNPIWIITIIIVCGPARNGIVVQGMVLVVLHQQIMMVMEEKPVAKSTVKQQQQHKYLSNGKKLKHWRV